MTRTSVPVLRVLFIVLMTLPLAPISWIRTIAVDVEPLSWTPSQRLSRPCCFTVRTFVRMSFADSFGRDTTDGVGVSDVAFAGAGGVVATPPPDDDGLPGVDDTPPPPPDTDGGLTT